MHVLITKVNMYIALLCFFVGYVYCGPATESYKGQFCTDPRTMRKHAAYTEWADAYSCTRHRCQPGGRNLAIYTVGCKRVEAPESAIECEEVVEDTNMQFPYCCTRLRCLVVVRGEVWTRVLGQPWETLPAAPWSHMYKMKKPPPADNNFMPKGPDQGPVYELVEPEDNKILRAVSAQGSTAAPNTKPKVNSSPDIVIALGTDNDHMNLRNEIERQTRSKKYSSNAFLEGDGDQDQAADDNDEQQSATEKIDISLEDNKYFENYKSTRKPETMNLQSWTEIPSHQWYQRAADTTTEPDTFRQETEEKPEVKSIKLQALVNAIGTRMRDIESVVQKMSEKVHETKAPEETGSSEKRQATDEEHHEKEVLEENLKRPSNDPDYKSRFPAKGHGSKYLRNSDSTTEPSLYLEDNHLNGYFSDASNSIIRRSNKDPVRTYMAPVETRRNTHILEATTDEKKHKKHHKKRKGKHAHKKHHKTEKKKKISHVSVESDKNGIVSIEDSSMVK